MSLLSLEKCEEEMFENGKVFCNNIDRDSSTMDNLCKRMNEILENRGRVDWHSYAGCATILYLGDRDEVRKAYVTLTKR